MISFVHHRIQLLGLLLVPLCTAVFLTLASGCDDRPSATAPTIVESNASDPETGVELHIETSHQQVDIADRIWLIVQWSYGTGTSPTLDDPDWDTTDWTQIEIIDQAPIAEGDRFVSKRSYLLEPFLPGEYSIPSPVLHLQSDGREPSEIQAPPLTIEVLGVLADSDTSDLAGLRGVIVPEDGPNESVVGIAAVLGGITIVGIIFVLWRARQPKRNPPLSTREQLTLISQGEYSDPDEAYARLAALLDMLDPCLRDTSEIQTLTTSIERARFDPAHSAPISPELIARHTLSLLGDDRDQEQSHITGVAV